MSAKKVRWIILLTNGLFLFTDQILKWQALHNWTAPNLISPYFGQTINAKTNNATKIPPPGASSEINLPTPNPWDVFGNVRAVKFMFILPNLPKRQMSIHRFHQMKANLQKHRSVFLHLLLKLGQK